METAMPVILGVDDEIASFIGSGINGNDLAPKGAKWSFIELSLLL